MRKAKKKQENYLLRVPQRPAGFTWSADEDGIVTLHIENKGAFNRAAQLLLKKPKVSHIHLDEIGSFVWPLIDGEKNLIEIAEPFEAHFGERVHPTYERLAEFFRILDSYGFVEWKKNNTK